MTPQLTLSEQRAALEREWAEWIPAGRSAPGRSSAVRTEVAQSWLRSLRTVDPAREHAPASATDIGPQWARSPLRAPVTALTEQLHSVADDAGYVAAVTDASGTILWTCGGQVMRKRAEQVNFAPGGRWDEAHMGTNALSLALRTDQPHTVFSAEHLVAALHGWVCYCAPIRAADGTLLGVLDLSTTWQRSHPLAMATVRTMVAAIESTLHTAAPAPTGMRLTCLGTGRLTRDGTPIRLRPRHLEILTLLALDDDGYNHERLHHAVYGDRAVGASTLKSEMSYLRRATGGEISSRVYRFTTPLSCDAVDVLRALAAGDLDTAVRLYHGPLLPDSETPGISEWRDHLEVAMRDAVLSSPDPHHALTYGDAAPDDIAVHEHALTLLPTRDPRRAVATARLHTAHRT
ncbi:GAF domain-containing protein [Nocardia sp. NPDC059177]|uniref:GAF domain-containing protein n=1 Tax=Nocardia sp. NPDC059177 TaxID=3346759 RepID=UPI0036B7B376